MRVQIHTVCELTHGVQNYGGPFRVQYEKNSPHLNFLHSRRDWRDWQIWGMHSVFLSIVSDTSPAFEL